MMCGYLHCFVFTRQYMTGLMTTHHEYDAFEQFISAISDASEWLSCLSWSLSAYFRFKLLSLSRHLVSGITLVMCYSIIQWLCIFNDLDCRIGVLASEG